MSVMKIIIIIIIGLSFQEFLGHEYIKLSLFLKFKGSLEYFFLIHLHS